MERLNIIMELSDGRSAEARLTKVFNPLEDNIIVTWKKTLVQETIPLAQVSCVLLAHNPEAGLKFCPNDPLEEVEILSKKMFHVRVPEEQNFETGFYGVLPEAGASHKYIFFPYFGVRYRRQYRPLGEILEEDGVVTRAEMDAVLRMQEGLKRRRLGEIIAELAALSQEDIDQALEISRDRGVCSEQMRIGECLVAAGLVSREQVDNALSQQATIRKKRIGTLLVEQGVAKAEQILAALATKHRMRFVNLETMTTSAEALAVLPVEMARAFQVFPLEAHDNSMVIAIAKPGNPAIGDALRQQLQCRFELVVAAPQQIQAAIAKYYPGD